MTEDEAKTKWCPFARSVTWTPEGCSNPRNRIAESEGGRVTVLAADLAGTQCIGSACMAWRVGIYDAAPEGPLPKLTANGFCGLAGKP